MSEQEERYERLATVPDAWIGVDLDGTLAHYDHWEGPLVIGPPIPSMVARVKRWHEMGLQVRIFTARVSDRDPSMQYDIGFAIASWCKEHLGFVLHATNVKDYGMVELWDDRAIQVERNTGRRMDGLPEVSGPS
jgi:hypothetical protein